ncbi:MAG TPA: ATP-binding cassette domain-containing protein [Firmicutes bacterium]|nr:ATP-binding cassette domain-containing protein [Bacillota bacterium]
MAMLVQFSLAKHSRVCATDRRPTVPLWSVASALLLLAAAVEILERILHVAGIDEFLGDLPDGPTLPGEKGFELSFGQQQRVGLARALVSKPEIFLLDEALSRLDSDIANGVFKQLRQLLNDRIVVLATHPLDARAHAERTIVIEDGRVVASGLRF